MRGPARRRQSNGACYLRGSLALDPCNPTDTLAMPASCEATIGPDHSAFGDVTWSGIDRDRSPELRTLDPNAETGSRGKVACVAYVFARLRIEPT
jgi:hypothetical protein